ncbi:MAG: hypothetical protein UW24_C0017G0003 [Parcubacteria group bacterium GW2011_GWA2_44_12]|nr:MAG: hypothetical protein UW24_C0017G0003 [Parcubacteria group bacterium GW2011_GWA2_44_12]
MNTLYRTTITIPQKIYQRTKIRAAYSNKSVSRFISDMLAIAIDVEQSKKPTPSLPFGAYAFNEKKTETYPRKKMYAAHLRRKISR